jgi:hypothetical protein
MSEAPKFDNSEYHRLDAELDRLLSNVERPDAWATGEYVSPTPYIKKRYSEIEKTFEETHPGFIDLKKMHEKYDTLFGKKTLDKVEYNRLPSLFKDTKYYEKKSIKKNYEQLATYSNGYESTSHVTDEYERLRSPDIMWTAWFQSGQPAPPPRKGGKTNKRRKQKKKSKRRRTLNY